MRCQHPCNLWIANRLVDVSCARVSRHSRYLSRSHARSRQSDRSDKRDADRRRRIERDVRLLQHPGRAIDLEYDRHAVVLPLGEDVIAGRIDLEVPRRPAYWERVLEG